jgi:outer membrane protein OmpA-like peptidoglycan-associated protein
MNNWKIAAAVLASLAPLAATAADDTGHWYLTPEIGRINTDDRRGVAPTDWLYGAKFGRHLSDVFSAELALSGTDLRGRTVDNLSLYGGMVDLLATANRGGAFAPYALVGVGVIDNQQRGGPDRTDFATEAGVGILTRLWRSDNGANTLSLRPEYKLRWDDNTFGRKMRDEIITVGLQFSFGAPTEAPVARTLPAEPEPPAAPPPPPPPPPPPADSDGDGVIDPQDACPGTPAGVAVDEKGCPRIGAITLEGVGFETNSNRLTADSRAVLDKVGADLKKYSGLRVELQGHTDSTGADAYNQRLSQQRAEAVRDYLIQSAAVPPQQLVAKGYGETQPVASNTTVEGRSVNRRVVMLVLSNSGEVKVTTSDVPQTTSPDR